MAKRKKHWRLAPYFPFVDFRGGKRGLGEVTRKDFVAIANILCGSGAPNGTVETLANYFSTTNARFDRARFERAARCDRPAPRHDPWKAK